jgi:pyruvate kinase
VQRPGVLLARKGLNRIEHPIELVDLAETDQQTVSRCLSVPGVDFAVSFASDGTEAAWIRRRAPDRRVILKVEREEALVHLDALAAHADELWICRGDLGAQLGLSNMANAVARIEPRRYAVPVLMAGQVLEHLTQHDQPTRSEVCHLVGLISHGYAGVVLSDETAIGIAPLNATRWAAQLMHDALSA